jgi:hypothetical protein
MSFDTGPGAYTPPPPKKGLSPWAWVGIGCGTITLLGFGGCAFLGFKLTQAINNAMSPEESVKAIQAAQIPEYPGAVMDPQATKGAGAMMRLMGGVTGGKVKMAMAAYRCPDEPAKVMEWYKVKLAATGYVPGPRESRTIAAAQLEQFIRGDEMAMVQTQNGEGMSKGCVLILAHIKGMPRRGNARDATR